MWRLVKSNDVYNRPIPIPKTSSAFFCIIPRNNSSSARPVDISKIITPNKRLNASKVCIKGKGCRILYSIKPKNGPVKAIMNWTFKFPFIRPTLFLLIP